MENSVCHYDWCYVSGRVNVLECNLLGVNFFEKLLSSDDFKDMLMNLSGTPLKAYFPHVKHLYEFETLLDDYYYSRLYEIRLLSPDSAVCDFFLIKNDFLNLKKFIKSKAFGTGIDNFYRGIINKNTWDDLWHGKETSLPEMFKELVSCIRKVIMSHSQNRIPPYPAMQKGVINDSPFEKGGQGGFVVPSQKWMKERVQSITSPVSPPLQGGDEGGGKKESLSFIIDLIFDGAYLRYIEGIYNKIDTRIIKRYLKTYQLVKGLEVIRRAMALRLDMNLLNQYFLEGLNQDHLFRKLAKNIAWSPEGTLREILVEAHCNAPLQGLLSNVSGKISFRYEVVSDDYLLDMLRSVKCIPFGPERVFGYLCGLTTEVFNLKLVLGGKVYRIENSLLKERLRKTYV
ncbi:MAG: V-type ATPase subunit [Planctomycetota bacterium]|nr:V-type ATPase subunit [Planctomycetota bacterium]